MKAFQADAVTSTQALLPNSLEDFQDGQSLGHLQAEPSFVLRDRHSFGQDIRGRQSIGDLQGGPSLDLDTQRLDGDLQSGQSLDLQDGQSLGNLGGAPDLDLLEDYEAETELDEDVEDISDRGDTRAKVGKVPEVVDSTFAPNHPILEPMAEPPWEVLQPLKSLQDADDQLFLDDVDGFMHQTNTVHDLQKQVAEQISEFENTWYLDQSQTLEEKNGNSGEIPRNFLETDLEERHRLEKRRGDFLEELRMQSEAAAGMASSTFGGEAGFRSKANLAANNVTSVGRSVQVAH